MSYRQSSRAAGSTLLVVLVVGGFVVAGLAVMAYLFLTARFEGSAEYVCDEPTMLTFPVPNRAVVERLLTVDALGVWVEGPIEEGRLRVQVPGWPEEVYSAEADGGWIDYRKGDYWTDEQFQLLLEPSAGARCSARIAYEFLVSL